MASSPETRTRWVATGVLFLPALFQVFPLFYLFCISFKLGGEVTAYPPTILPRQFQWDNYVTAFQAAPLTRFLVNSLVVSAAIAGLQLVTSILAAYALARLEFRGRLWVLALFLGTMMVPGEVTIVPNYFTLAGWNWLDTYQGLIVPFGASGFGVFLLYQFFRTVPKELEEAAIVDGSSRLRFLFQILIPLSLPAILALFIYSFVSAWNQYLWPLVVTQSTEMQTVQIGIGMLRSQNESVNWGVVMAATASFIAPSVLLFLVTQRHFVRGITMSGLKG